MLKSRGVASGDKLQLISTPTKGANEAGIKDNKDWRINLHERAADLEQGKQISDMSIPMGSAKKDINISAPVAPPMGGGGGPRM